MMKIERALGVTAPTFDEIRTKLLDAGFDWMFNDTQDELRIGEFIIIREGLRVWES